MNTYSRCFQAIDELSEKLGSIGGGFMTLGNRAVEAGSKRVRSATA